MENLEITYSGEYEAKMYGFQKEAMKAAANDRGLSKRDIYQALL